MQFTDSISSAQEDENNDDIDTSEYDILIIFFYLETSNLKKDRDILQIAAKCGGKEFNIYILDRGKKLFQVLLQSMA